MLTKNEVLDLLWQYSRFNYAWLLQSEQSYREGKGFAAITLLFTCVENVSKSAIERYNLSLYNTYHQLYQSNFITAEELAFLNEGPCCIRKIRNLYAHANLAALNIKTTIDGQTILLSLSEDDTALYFYKCYSDLIFNLILKVISHSFIDTVRENLTFDYEVNEVNFEIVTLTSADLLKIRGFPANYFDGVEDIPEATKIRLLDNAPDIGNLTGIMKAVDDHTNK